MTKKLYDIGEIPPLGYVPEEMHAWCIRRERLGNPENAMIQEVVPVPELGCRDVLIMVMAAGVNYNGVWASLGAPISVFDVHGADYHIAGSDASGVVWWVGSEVKRWKIGDEIVVHCSRVDGDDEECNGGDPMLSSSQKIWGYETPDGSFAQFAKVRETQLVHRSKHLTWEQSGCYMLTLATAFRMLFGHPPHTVSAGQNVLIWGASGGLGSMAVQLVALTGANAVGVVSAERKREFVMSLGARGVINRQEFDCWGQLPDIGSECFGNYLKEARRFGKAIREITGHDRDADIVFEHPGEATFPVSCMVTKRGGMIVFCAGTTGYNLTFDARIVWMRQKRIQGSHFASLMQCHKVNELVREQRIDPCMSEVSAWDEIPKAHTKMLNNEQIPGNMAVLVQAPRAGLRTLDHGA